MMIRANLTLLRRRHRPKKGHSRPRIHHGNNTEISSIPHFGHISHAMFVATNFLHEELSRAKAKKRKLYANGMQIHPRRLRQY